VDGPPCQAEAMSPVCLPRFNPAAFLHAYIHYLDAGRSGLVLALLSAHADSFFQMAEARSRMQETLDAQGATVVCFRV
jgi:vacuolar fusion protein MON1